MKLLNTCSFQGTLSVSRRYHGLVARLHAILKFPHIEDFWLREMILHCSQEPEVSRTNNSHANGDREPRVQRILDHASFHTTTALDITSVLAVGPEMRNHKRGDTMGKYPASGSFPHPCVIIYGRSELYTYTGGGVIILAPSIQSLHDFVLGQMIICLPLQWGWA